MSLSEQVFKVFILPFLNISFEVTPEHSLEYILYLSSAPPPLHPMYNVRPEVKICRAYPKKFNQARKINECGTMFYKK